MKVHRNKSAFTIVELAIVIAVIAILAAILIPTFADILQKAQNAVDCKTIRSMNNIVTSYGKAIGSPLTAEDVKAVLIEYGYDNLVLKDQKNIYYWDENEQLILAWNKSRNKLICLPEFSEKYADLEAPLEHWVNLADILSENTGDSESSGSFESKEIGENDTENETGKMDIVEIPIDEGENGEEELLNAIKNAKAGTCLKIRESVTINIDVEKFNEALKDDSGEGRNIILDLNESSIAATAESGIIVPPNCSLTIMNGKINISVAPELENDVYAILINENAEFSLIDTKLNSEGFGIVVAAGARKLLIDKCEIESEALGVSTYKKGTSRTNISIFDSKISGDTAVCITFETDTKISNSELIGQSHGLVVKNGTAEIEDSVIKAEGDPEAVYTCYDFFTLSSYAPYETWRDGNAIPAAALVVGNYQNENEITGEAEINVYVKLANVTLESSSPQDVPNILLAARSALMNVKVEYDSPSKVDQSYVIVYGSDCPSNSVTIEHKGTMTVNGSPAKLKDNKTVIG